MINWGWTRGYHHGHGPSEWCHHGEVWLPPGAHYGEAQLPLQVLAMKPEARSKWLAKAVQQAHPQA